MKGRNTLLACKEIRYVHKCVCGYGAFTKAHFFVHFCYGGAREAKTSFYFILPFLLPFKLPLSGKMCGCHMTTADSSKADTANKSKEGPSFSVDGQDKGLCEEGGDKGHGPYPEEPSAESPPLLLKGSSRHRLVGPTMEPSPPFPFQT